jgi:HPr kinase/phosphorylase
MRRGAGVVISGRALDALSRRPDAQSGLLKRLRDGSIPFVALAGAERLPPWVHELSVRSNVGWLCSSHDPYLLTSRLIGLLQEKIDRRRAVGGVLVAAAGRGVLLLGASGAGKTSCSLVLVSRGYTWIADDVVLLREAGGCLFGSAPERIAGLLELKGRGIVRAEDVMAAGSVAGQAVVEAAVRLTRNGPVRGAAARRQQRVMGVRLPVLHVRSGRDAGETAGRVEAAVGAYFGTVSRHG